MIKKFFILACVLGVVACSGVKPSDPQYVVEPNRVDLRLADAADRAAQAMQTLAEVEAAKNPPPLAQRLDNVPLELKRTVTITWVGPAAQLASRMADRAGYRFMTLGDQPPVPLIVNVDVVNRPIMDVLRDIGLQMGQRGAVVLDADNRIVEVHYAPAIQ